MNRAVLPLLVLSTFLSGCASYAARQTPRVLKEGTRVFGAGASLGGSPQTGHDHIAPTDVYMRLPTTSGGVDAGFRVSGYPPWYWYLLTVDCRFQVTEGAFLSALAVGFQADLASGSGLNATWIGGTDRLYGGFRFFYLFADGDLGEEGGKWRDKLVHDPANKALEAYDHGFIPGVFVGACVGDRLRILPEVGAFLGANGRPYLFGGIAVEWVHRRAEGPAAQHP